MIIFFFLLSGFENNMQTICLLREQYANIFEALKIGWGPTNNENHEDRLAQILTDLHDGDVPSDNGQEELSDSERDLRLTDKWWRPWRSNWTREQKRLHMSWWWERRTRRYIYVELDQNWGRDDKRLQTVKICCLVRYKPVTTKCWPN